jgi:hypothetical protein
MTTTIHFSGLHHAACLLATPGSVRPLTGRHAGSLLTCWLGFNQVGLAPCGAHLLGNNNLFHGLSPNSKVSSLPWRDQCLVRQGVLPRMTLAHVLRPRLKFCRVGTQILPHL